jgi:hypothetical protein
VYGAEKGSTRKRRQFQVPLNRALQAATTWSDADRQNAMERFEIEIHHVTPAKRKHVDELFQYHERQLLQEVGTKSTGPKSIFAKELAILKAVAKDEAYGAATKPTDKRVHYQIRLSDAERAGTTWRLADTENMTKQLEREMYGITWNEQMRFKIEFFLRLIEFEALRVTISIRVLQKTVQQCIIHFGYISNNHSSRVKHPSVPDGPDRSDRVLHASCRPGDTSRCILTSITMRLVYASSERHVCYTLRRGCSYAVGVHTTPGNVYACLRPIATFYLFAIAIYRIPHSPHLCSALRFGHILQYSLRFGYLTCRCICFAIIVFYRSEIYRLIFTLSSTMPSVFHILR